jgi:pilus assembly protein Flp/PilA
MENGRIHHDRAIVPPYKAISGPPRTPYTLKSFEPIADYAIGEMRVVWGAPAPFGASRTDSFFSKWSCWIMKNFLKRFVREDEGQDLIEYAFLAVFIALVVTVALGHLGSTLNTKFQSIATSVNSGS